MASSSTSAGASGGSAAAAASKKPWRYYYVLVFPYSGSALSHDKLQAMCDATDAMEQKEEDYLCKIAERYAVPEKLPPLSPLPDVIRRLLQRIALCVLVLMALAPIIVCCVYNSDTGKHIDSDVVYAAVACIAAVAVVHALGYAALAYRNRLAMHITAILLVLLCIALCFAIDQFVALQQSQTQLQQHLTHRLSAFDASNVATLVNGGAIPSLLHRFTFDGSVHFLRWLQRHCVRTVRAAPPGNMSNATNATVDVLAFYQPFWRPQTHKCVDAVLASLVHIETATLWMLTALVAAIVVQLMLYAVLYVTEPSDADVALRTDDAATARRKQRAKAVNAAKTAKQQQQQRRTRSRRKHHALPLAAAPLQTLLASLLGAAGFATSALAANVLLACDVAASADVYEALAFVGAMGIVAVGTGLAVTCCRIERSVFIVSTMLVLLAAANVVAVSQCVAISQRLQDEAESSSSSDDAGGTDAQATLLRDAVVLVDHQTCALVRDWRAHTCEHDTRNSSLSNATASALTPLPFDAVCANEFAALLRVTLQTAASWLSTIAALSALLLLVLLAPSIYEAATTLGYGACMRLWCVSTAPSATTATETNKQRAPLCQHATLTLEDARARYLSGLRIKDVAALAVEAAAFDAEWAKLTGRSSNNTLALHNAVANNMFTHEFEALVRVLVIQRLVTRCKLDVSLSISRDGTTLFAKVAASDNLLLATLCDADDYTLELADYVDPGPAFWQRDKREVKNDLAVIDVHAIKPKLQRFAATNVLPKREAEWDPATESLARVSARIHVLERAARVAAGTLRCTSRHLSYAPYVPQREVQCLFKKHSHRLELPGVVRRASVLRTIDSMRLTRRLLDAELHVDVMVQCGLLQSYQCLHSASRFDMTTRTSLAASWVFFWRLRDQLPGECDPVTHYVRHQLTRCSPFRQPLRRVRDYFGETIAFYFAWLACYAQWLAVVAVGVLAMLAIAFDIDDPVLAAPRAFYLSPSSSDATQSASTRFVLSTPAIALGVSVVASALLFTKYWERQSVWFALEWGMSNTIDTDMDLRDRAGFWGDRRPNAVTNELETHFPSHRRLLRQLASIVVVLALSAALAIRSLTLTLVQGPLVSYGGLNRRAAVLVSNAVHAAAIQFSSARLTHVARALSELENYQHATAFERSVVAKVFALEVVNTYAGLWLLAFVDVAAVCSSLPGLQVAACLFHDDIAMHVSSLVQLETLLLLIFVGRIATHVVSLVRRVAHRQLGAVSSGGTTSAAAVPVATSVEAEVALDVYGGAFVDYTQIVVQFGLVTMFASVCPLVSVLALVECVLELRLDALDLCLFYQRPAPDAATGIGCWTTCLQLQLKLALATLCGFAYCTAANDDNESRVQRLSAWVVATLTSWLLVEVVWLVLPATSTAARDASARNAFLVERYFGADAPSIVTSDDSSSGGGGGGVAIEAGDELPLDSSIELNRERAELLRRLNVAMRRRDDIVDVPVGITATTPASSSSDDGEKLEVAIDVGGLKDLTRDPIACDDDGRRNESTNECVDEGRHKQLNDYRSSSKDDEDDNDEAMVVGYFKPVRSGASSAAIAQPASPIASSSLLPSRSGIVAEETSMTASAALNNMDALTATAATPTATAPNDSTSVVASATTISRSSDDVTVAVGIPIAENVRERSASLSSIDASVAAVIDAVGSTTSAQRSLRRVSFFTRLAKREVSQSSSSSTRSGNANANANSQRLSRRRSSSSSSSSSTEGLLPFSLAVFRRPATTLSPALRAATTMERGDAAPQSQSNVVANATVESAVRQTSSASDGIGVGVGASDASATVASSDLVATAAQSVVDIPRQYTTKDLEGTDAIHEATQRSRFDFHNDDDESQFKPKATAAAPPKKKAKKPSFFSRMRRPATPQAAAALPTVAATTTATTTIRPSETHALLPTRQRLELSGIEAVRAATQHREFDFSRDADDDDDDDDNNSKYGDVA